MSKISDAAKFELVLKYIDDIDRIITRHETIEATMTDYEGQYAVMMCLTQIAETISNIDNDAFEDKIPFRAIRSFRNRTVHNYEATDWTIVKHIVEYNLPDLRQTIIAFLKRLL